MVDLTGRGARMREGQPQGEGSARLRRLSPLSLSFSLSRSLFPYSLLSAVRHERLRGAFVWGEAAFQKARSAPCVCFIGETLLPKPEGIARGGSPLPANADLSLQKYENTVPRSISACFGAIYLLGIRLLSGRLTDSFLQRFVGRNDAGRFRELVQPCQQTGVFAVLEQIKLRI